jgi:hypothetical protein
MKYKLLIIAVALGVTGAAVAGALYLAYPVQITTLAAMARNYLLSWSAPPGTTTTELNAAYKAGPLEGPTGPGSRIWSISPERCRICKGSA